MEIPLYWMQAGPFDPELASQPPTGSRRLTYEGSYDVVAAGRRLAAVLLRQGFGGSRLDWECSPELYAKETSAVLGNQLTSSMRVSTPRYVDELDEVGWEGAPIDESGFGESSAVNTLPPNTAQGADAHAARQRALRHLHALRSRQEAHAEIIAMEDAGPMLVISSYPALTQQVLGLCYDPPMSVEDAAELPVTPGELFELTDGGAGVVSLYRPRQYEASSVNIKRMRNADHGPPELWVVRHAQDRVGAKERLNGHSEHGLTDLGYLQALTVSVWMLEYATHQGVWITSGTSSPLARALHTFDLINKRLGRWSPRRDRLNDNLRERGAGLATYRTKEEIAGLAKEHSLQSLPGLPDYYEGFLYDESYVETYDRVSEEIERLWSRQQTQGGVGIVVTHGMAGKMIVGYWNGMTRDDVPRILRTPGMANGEVVRLREVDGRREEVSSLFRPTRDAIETYWPGALRMLQRSTTWAL